MNTQLKQLSQLKDLNPKGRADWCMEQLHKTGVCISKGAKLNKVENSEPYWCDSNIELNADGTTTHNDL